MTRGAVQQSSPRLQSPSDLMLRIFDGLLAAVVLLAPLFMGGRHPLGKLVYVVIVCAMSLAWFFAQCFKREGRWRWSSAELLVAAGTLLLLNKRVRPAVLVLFVLNLIFMLALSSLIVRGIDIVCGCFRPDAENKTSPPTAASRTSNLSRVISAQPITES